VPPSAASVPTTSKNSVLVAPGDSASTRRPVPRVVPQRFGKAQHEGLGGSVDRHVGGGLIRRIAGHVYQETCANRAQRTDESVADVHQCRDVEGNLLAYALSILFVELPVSAETGIVDQAGRVQAASFDFCGEDRTDRRLAEV